MYFTFAHCSLLDETIKFLLKKKPKQTLTYTVFLPKYGSVFKFCIVHGTGPKSMIIKALWMDGRPKAHFCINSEKDFLKIIFHNRCTNSTCHHWHAKAPCLNLALIICLHEIRAKNV